MHGAVSIRPQDPYSRILQSFEQLRTDCLLQRIGFRNVAARQRGIQESSNSYFRDSRFSVCQNASLLHPSRKEFTRRIPVRTRTAIITKEEERRRRDAAFRATAGCKPSAMPQANAAAIARPAASWHSLQPHQCFDVKRLREQIEHVHFRDFIADAWPSDFFRLPG